MKKRIILDNIIKVKADALIYSTNIDLRLSGGVGAALLQKYGSEIQDKLFETIDNTGRQVANIGEVFECTVPTMPWKVVYHTVATNDMYETQAETVHSIIKYCLLDCDGKDGIDSIVMSALGCGWGDLSHSDFIDIITEVTGGLSFCGVNEIVVCCDDQTFYEQMCELAIQYDGSWDYLR